MKKIKYWSKTSSTGNPDTQYKWVLVPSTKTLEKKINDIGNEVKKLKAKL